ncbi:MAG: glycosyltransferase [Caldilineales bacterium]|nr:glycosyltransferase [Caldilineales bacterium]MCW5856735.1 glycosyltransferase [Caldilineales bacterium]
MIQRSKLRRSPAYSVWRSYREVEQLKRFNRILDAYLRNQQASEPYSEAYTRRRLAQIQQQRHPLLAYQGTPSIIAFGTNDWEQYGLWPSLERVSHFVLFDYHKWLLSRGMRRSDPQMCRRLAAAFLETIDTVPPDNKPTLAFFYAAGTYIADELLVELAHRGIWTIVMSLDDKQQFAKGADQLRVAAHCDLYWTVWKTGTQIVLDLGGTPWYAPEAADPAFYHPMGVVRDFDIVFIGQSYGLRADLVRYLRRRGFNVVTFGSGWPNGFVSFEDVVEIYSRAHIVLGVGGVGQMAGVRHLKGRDFEAPMCGALYLTSYNPELADHFRIGEEILCYSSSEECADIIHWVQRHPEEAERIRQAALQRSTADHTWEIRLQHMFSLFPESTNAETAG